MSKNTEYQKLLKKSRTSNSKEAEFRGLVHYGGNYLFDLNNELQRKTFVESYEKSHLWKRVFEPQDLEDPGYDENLKHLYLTEVSPLFRKCHSRFYIDYDNLKLFTPEKIVESALSWTRIICGSDCRMFSFISQKENAEKRLHFYWPDLIINNKKEMYRLALSLNVYTGLDCDFSVYSSGLRLPGCFKGRSEKDIKENKPIDIAYYVWFDYLTPTRPTVDDILLVPTPNQTSISINWSLCDKVIGKSQQEIDCLIESMPGSGGTNTRAKNNKKRKLDNSNNAPKQNNNLEEVQEMEEITGTWKNVEIPQRIWDLVEKYSGFKGPFVIQNQGYQKYSWIVDYDHLKSRCVLLKPGVDKHDRVGFILHWNPKTEELSYYCLSGKCRVPVYIRKTNSHPAALTIDIDPVALEKAIHPNEHFTDDINAKPCQRKFPKMDYKLLISLAQSDIDKAVEYFNNYCGMMDGSCWCFLSSTWKNLSKNLVHNQLSHIKTITGKCFFDVWCEHVNHRVLDDVRLIPKFPDGLPPTELNLWTGYQIEPSNLPHDELMESVSAWRQQIREGWCREDPSKPDTSSIADYCEKLFAHMIQFPWIKTGVPVVLYSRPGAGKNVPFVGLQKIYGKKHCWVISDLDEVFGNFNSHVSQAIIVVFDEVVYNKSRKVANKLKNYTTAETMPLKEKFCNMLQLEHYANTFILSNNRQVLPIDAGDRRYFILAPDNSKTGRRNYATYKDFYDKVRNVDPSHLLQYLLSVDLTGFDPRNIPDTQEHWNQLMMSLAPVPLWLHDIIMFTPPEVEMWFDADIPLSTIYEHFDKTIPNHRMNKVLFFDSLEAEYGIKRAPQRKRLEGFQHPQHYLHFPSLKSLKHRFAEWTDKTYVKIFGTDEDENEDENEQVE